jgi:hypothetical protein
VKLRSELTRPSRAISRYAGGVAVGFLLLAASASAQSPTPIPNQTGALPVPEHVGQPALPHSIHTKLVPQSSFMAPNGLNSIHLDAYQSDTFPVGQKAPLGFSPKVSSNYLNCISTLTLTNEGQVIGICVPAFNGAPTTTPFLYLLASDTLATTATLNLPDLQNTGSAFGGGGYFYLDQDDNVVFPTGTNQIWQADLVNGDSFGVAKTCDLSPYVPYVGPDAQVIQSVFPDHTGRLWFTSSGGTVGTATYSGPSTCDVKVSRLPTTDKSTPEPTSKSFATDPTRRGGIFIVSDYALYRFDADSDGAPEITWREPYDRGTRVKPGQVQQGSGTTPTLIGRKYVTIADNADPEMHVVVFKRAAKVEGSRLVCSEPVFQPFRGATENSLIATDRSIIIENNYGYVGPQSTENGLATTPGITRVDLADNQGNDAADSDPADGCHTVWTNNELAVPTVVSQASLWSGLVYTYSKNAGPETTDAW